MLCQFFGDISFNKDANRGAGKNYIMGDKSIPL